MKVVLLVFLCSVVIVVMQTDNIISNPHNYILDNFLDKQLVTTYKSDLNTYREKFKVNNQKFIDSIDKAYLSFMERFNNSNYFEKLYFYFQLKMKQSAYEDKIKSDIKSLENQIQSFKNFSKQDSLIYFAILKKELSK